MSLFFDAAWFDGRLAGLGLDRGDLAAAAGVDRANLHEIFVNNRPATAEELGAFADLLGVDMIEMALRSGVAGRAPSTHADALARIDQIEARLDAVDAWIEEFERQRRSA